MPENATQRDEQLARSILNVVKIVGEKLANGWVAGTVVFDQARDADGAGLGDESHAERLIADVLLKFGLIEEERNLMAAGGGGSEFRRRRFRLTSFGYAVWMERDDVPPVPGLADPRLGG